jgi:hypothetical protein
MRGFLLILVAGLGCAALGSGVGWLLGSLSPEFIELIAQPYPVAEPPRLGAALGLVCGLLLGAIAMALGLLVEAFRVWAVRNRTARELPPNQPPTGPSGGGMTSTAIQRPGG